MQPINKQREMEKLRRSSSLVSAFVCPISIAIFEDNGVLPQPFRGTASVGRRGQRSSLELPILTEPTIGKARLLTGYGCRLQILK